MTGDHCRSSETILNDAQKQQSGLKPETLEGLRRDGCLVVKETLETGSDGCDVEYHSHSHSHFGRVTG